jgi:serine/threonine protein kinase
MLSEQPVRMNGSRASAPQTKWIWPFELLDRIGEGGMGVVYRARYVVNNREVAVKMLPADVTDKTVLARFEREMEVLKNLRHPNIVRCFGGSCEDKQRFYAMELISGGSLEDVLQSRGKLSWEQVIDYGQQMCAGLDASHKAGVVHRDVKPSNFLVGPNNTLKLSDFGLASVAAARKITAAGKTAGTLLYMSPEQIRGGEVTPASDIYALGCVFYELLTGRPPFVGDSPAATLHMHCKQEIPRASQVALDCPPVFESLIIRMMAKDPAQRPESAAGIAIELGKITPTITVVQTNRQQGRRVSQRPTGMAQESEPLASDPSPVAVAAIPTRQRVAPWIPITMGAGLLVSLAVIWFQARGIAEGRDAMRLATELMQSSNPVVRAEALTGVGGLNHVPPHVMGLVVSHLSDADYSVRIAAASALGQSGERARPALAELLRVQKEDANADVRQAAGKAIDRIKEAPGRRSWILTSFGIGLFAAAGYGLWRWYRKLMESDVPPPPRPVATW